MSHLNLVKLPLVGRASAFNQLIGSFQQAQQGQPQAVLVVGEVGIGKTRLVTEFVAWAQSQGAEVLSGYAIAMGGRLPYQLPVEALRQRMQAENAPENLVEDLWLAELARLLPELRVRYPDLPAPTQDELAAKVRLFEAVARLVDALAKRTSLVLLLEDLHWVDGASLDLLRYLGGYWKEHGSRVLLLGTMRSDQQEPRSQLSAELSDLGWDLPVTQITLQALSQAETIQLMQAIAGEGECGRRSGGEQCEHGLAGVVPAQEAERPLVGLGDFLFAQTGGQPLYLLEMLKLWRDLELLVPRLGADGIWRLKLDVEMAAVVVQEQSRRELLPPSMCAMIQARLAKLTQPARQLVRASAVLGNQATAKLLWQVAELGVQAGAEALKEAVRSGLLREEQAGGPGVGQLGRYSFSHEPMRDVVYSELSAARRQVLHQRAFVLLQAEGARASELAYHALFAGEAEAAYRASVQAGDEAVAVFAAEDAIGHYEQARALLQDQKPLQTELAASEVERLYTHLGRAFAFLNAWDKAQQAYEELVAYARQQHLPTLGSMALNRLAIVAVQQSKNRPQVQALLEEAWRMAQTSHDQLVLAETEWNLAQIHAVGWGDPTRAFPHGQQALEMARGIHHKELEARSLSLLGVMYTIGGDFEEATHCLEAALALYALLGNESSVSGELSLPYYATGAPLTQPLTNRATEASCWALLALAQVNCGQVFGGIRSGRKALALAQESKSVWAQVTSTLCLSFGLLEAGAYEEALGLTQHATALARTLPPTLHFQSCLNTLGSVYQAVQQWEEAHSALEEAEAVAERLGLEPHRVTTVMRLCMHCAVAGNWEAAYQYAVQACALRKSYSAALIPQYSCSQYETEAFVRGGDERQAREEVHRLGERLGSNRRFHLPYLRSLAVLAEWEGHREQAIDHLRQAAQLAAEIGLPAEQWQIQAALGRVYEAGGEQGQARTAFSEAARIIQGLAEGIGDETLRSRFLTGPQIHPVVQHARHLASAFLEDRTEPSGR